MKQKLYPLTFQPVYKEKIWGGRLLEKIFPRELPTGLIGESWDVAAHRNGVSVVDQGQLQGWDLIELVAEYGEELLGSKGLNSQGLFPLLLKLIDANSDLSIQVHPDDNQVQQSQNDVWGKSEMWYIVHSEPGSWIIWGLRPETTKEELAKAVESGGNAILACLNKVYVQPGELYPISAGLVHALGAGVVVAEIQQNSDTTYRLYDWDRRDDQGQPRELHIEQALEVIDYSPHSLDNAYQLKRCERFFRLQVLRRPRQQEIEVQDGFQILTVLEGPAVLSCRGLLTTLRVGESCLLPACLDDCVLSARGVVLQSSLA